MADINYEENRFGYLKEYSEKRLLKEKREIESELENLCSEVESGNIKSEQLVDFRNDIIFLQEELDYINRNIHFTESNLSKKSV